MKLRTFVGADFRKSSIVPSKPMVPSKSASTFPTESLLDITTEAESLAATYVSRHVLPPKFTDDARHVAACTVAQLEYLVSWNFRHLVNVEREKGFNAVNMLQGYRTVRIDNPLELIFGNED